VTVSSEHRVGPSPSSFGLISCDRDGWTGGWGGATRDENANNRVFTTTAELRATRATNLIPQGICLATKMTVLLSESRWLFQSCVELLHVHVHRRVADK
jgi:hypothetical protein